MQPLEARRPTPFLRRYLNLLSYFLEYLLSLALRFLHFTFFPASVSQSKAKGKAVVIYAPCNDALARYFAIRIASGSPSSFAFSDSGAAYFRPQPPLHCILILGDPLHLPIVVAQWAAKRVQIEQTWRSRLYPHPTEESNPSSPTQPDASSSSSESDSSERVNDQFHRHQANPSTKRERSSSTNRSKYSLSDWIAPGILGRHIDLLKGWRIGLGSKPEIGSVIPIVADLQSSEGLSYANSTISAYVSSHDLLLSGIIHIPSILSPHRTLSDQLAEVDDPSHDSLGNEPPYKGSRSRSSVFSHVVTPPMSPTTLRAQDAQDEALATLRTALRTDVTETAALVHALFPDLKRDGGRVVALVPGGFGPPLPEYLEFRADHHLTRDMPLPPPDVHIARWTTQGSPWPATTAVAIREALNALWASSALEMAGYGVHVSTIVTPPLLRPAPPGQPTSHARRASPFRRPERPERFSLAWALLMLTRSGRMKLSGAPPYHDWFEAPAQHASSSAPPVRVHPPSPQLGYRLRSSSVSATPRGMPRPRLSKRAIAFARSLVHLLLALERPLRPFDDLDEYIRPAKNQHATQQPAEDALLLEAIRAAVTEKAPRHRYHVGLAAALADFVACLPGALTLKTGLVDAALGLTEDEAY